LDKQPLVYEINTRCWLHDLAALHRSPITLGNVPNDEFVAWQRLGFTHIWLMGVWECGPLLNKEPDAVPSPYAITGYTVPAALGGNAALAAIRARLHEHGLQLLLDFVPNHTSCVHPWLKSAPDRYVQSGVRTPDCFPVGSSWIAHGKDPYFPAWVDTAQLDYRNPQTRLAMVEELLRVCSMCDGVRCDMSMLLLNEVFARTWSAFPSSHPTPTTEFWNVAIQRVRQVYPDCLFLAEAYWDLEQRLLDLGFDYTYDKRVYDHLVARDPSALLQHIRSKGETFLACSTHFLENHDEPRIASLLNFDEHRAASLLTLALPGMRLLHEGQLTGSTVRASVHSLRRVPEPAQPSIAAWYEGLLGALKNSAAGKGKFDLLPASESVFAIRWQREPGNLDLAVVNLGHAPGQFSIPLPGAGWRITDRLGPEDPHNPVILAPQGAKLLNCREM
jgi:glycosidase